MPKQRGGRTRWVITKIPHLLEEQTRSLLANHPELGYTGPPEFFRDAIREKIERINEINSRKEGNRK